MRRGIYTVSSAVWLLQVKRPALPLFDTETHWSTVAHPVTQADGFAMAEAQADAGHDARLRLHRQTYYSVKARSSRERAQQSL